MSEKRKIEKKDCKRIDNFVRKMLENNQIPGLIVSEHTGDFDQDRNKDLKNIREKLGPIISTKDIEHIYKKIYEIKKSLENYMIGEEFIFFDLDHIYMNNREEIFILETFESQKRDISDLYIQIISDFVIEYKDEAEKLLDISNYFKSGDYNLEGLLDKFFTSPIQNNRNIVEYKKTVKKESSIRKTPKANRGILSRIKTSFISSFLVKKKEDYKERSLNINFRLPKK